MNREIKIKYFGPIRNVIGIREEEISVAEETNVRELIQILVGKHKTKYSFFGYGKNDNLRPRVLLDGKDIEDMEGLNTSLKGFSEITVFEAFLAGGG